jgi:hypothetical protein
MAKDVKQLHKSSVEAVADTGEVTVHEQIQAKLTQLMANTADSVTDETGIAKFIHLTVMQQELWAHEDLAALRSELTEPAERVELLNDVSESIYKLNKMDHTYREIELREQQAKAGQQSRPRRSKKDIGQRRPR